MKTHSQKNTLLQAAQGNAETKACKRVFFSPTQKNFFPTLPFLIKLFSQRTGFARIQTDSASNINRFVESVVHNPTRHIFGRTAPHAANIKIKRNLKKKGFIGYRKFVQVMNCVQVCLLSLLF